MEDFKNLTDEEIVNYVRTKDQEMYLEIVLRYQEKLLRYANYLIQDSARAADAVQNAFIKAFVNLQSFKTNMKFSSWIYRIAHNEAINEIKKHKKETPFPEHVDFASDENMAIDLDQEKDRQRVLTCLRKIPLAYAEPLSLFFFEGKTYNEISDILRLPVGTVGTRINRAKILMKKICQAEKK